MFNHEQQQCLDLGQAGHNTLILGQAGTGKSYILNELTKLLKLMRKNVATTATTGLACRQLLGTPMTIHR